MKDYSILVRCDPAELDEHPVSALRTRVEAMDGVELQAVDFVTGAARLFVSAASPAQAKERAVEAAERFLSEEADWQADEPVELLD